MLKNQKISRNAVHHSSTGHLDTVDLTVKSDLLRNSPENGVAPRSQTSVLSSPKESIWVPTLTYKVKRKWGMRNWSVCLCVVWERGIENQISAMNNSTERSESMSNHYLTAGFVTVGTTFGAAVPLFNNCFSFYPRGNPQDLHTIYY